MEPRWRVKNFLEQLSYLPRAWQLVRAAAPRWTAAWAVLLVLQGSLPALSVWLTRLLVDSLVAAIGSGHWSGARRVWWLVAAMAGALLLMEALNSAGRWVRAAQAERVQDHLLALIHEQALTLDLSFYDSPAYYDRLHQARVDALHRPVALLESLGSLLQNGLTLAAMAGLLLPFGWWVPLALLLSALPALAIVGRFAWRQNQWHARSTPARRRAHYYDYLLTEQSAAAELRLFNLGPHFRAAFQSLRARLRAEQIALAREQAKAELLARGLGLLAMGATLAWVLWRAVQGLVSLGEAAMFYQAFNQGQRLMRTLLEKVGQIYSNTLFLGNLLEFLALRPRLTDPPHPAAAPPLREAIQFQDVTFRYPGSARPALLDFNLTIKAGTLAAVVGENGAGKSTLLKLLCRFYDAEAGAVKLDGVDVRALAQAELWRNLTALFQEPVRFQATAGENIALGDVNGAPALAAVTEAARAASAERLIEKLPDGYETMLSKKFGGSELSVGEWQRVALARAFVRPAPLIILDEPTSAMDPWSEAEWIARFRSLAAGRTALIITHRLTTARQADVIHVMAEGRIIESGSHEDLLARNGRYAQSWRQQMRDGHHTNGLCRECGVRAASQSGAS